MQKLFTELDSSRDRKCIERQCILCIQGSFENCICSLDNWGNETNLDKKQNICHFKESDLIFLLNAPQLAL